jgi:hypothetical protein
MTYESYEVEWVEAMEARAVAAETALAQVREVHRNHEASVDGYELWRDLGVALSLVGSVPTVQGEAKLPQNSVPVITEEPR